MHHEKHGWMHAFKIAPPGPMSSEKNPGKPSSPGCPRRSSRRIGKKHFCIRECMHQRTSASHTDRFPGRLAHQQAFVGHGHVLFHEPARLLGIVAGDGVEDLLVVDGGLGHWPGVLEVGVEGGRRRTRRGSTARRRAGSSARSRGSGTSGRCPCGRPRCCWRTAPCCWWTGTGPGSSRARAMSVRSSGLAWRAAAAGGLALDDLPGVEDFAGVLRGRHGDDAAVLLALLQEAFRHQPVQGHRHRRPADSQLFGPGRLPGAVSPGWKVPPRIIRMIAR